MIMPTPSAELFQATASASAKAVTTEEKFLTNIQQGFISCVKKISNSLVTMKDAVVEGYHRLTVRMKPSAAKAPASTLNMTALSPISEADSRKFIHELEQKLAVKSDSINGMCRENPTNAYGKFNQQLKTHNDVLAPIENDKIDDVDIGFLISRWLELPPIKNKFSAEDCKKLVAHKDNRNEIARIFNGKFNSPKANNVENRDKLVSLLYVMQAYKDLHASSSNMQNRPKLSTVVEFVTIPLIFDLDTHQAPSSPAAVERRRQALTEAQAALMVLMKHCPITLSPELDMPRSH